MLYVRKIKINVTKEQQLLIDSQSKIANWLYNHYLAVSIRYYRLYHKTLTYCRMNHSFSKFKDKHPFLKTVNNTVLKNTLRTLEKSFKSFFRRLKKGDNKAGFPKFKSWKLKWRNLEYDKGCGFKLFDKKTLKLNFGRVLNKETGKKFIPSITINLKEEIEVNPQQVTITKTYNKYYACFRCEREKPKIKQDGNIVSLDLNQSNLFAMVNDKSESVIMGKPKIATYFDKQLDNVKSKRDKCKKHSRRFEYLNKTISRLYKKRREQIKLCVYTIAHRIAQTSKLVLIGDYVPFKSGIKNINKGVITKGLVGKFRQTLLWVCKKLGVETKLVNEYLTSKTCHKCGNVKANLSLKDRVYKCNNCGLIIDRDVNSAINIMNKTLPRMGEHFVEVSTVNWKWMSNCLSTGSLQINQNVAICST